MRYDLLCRRLDPFHVAEHEDAGYDADCDEHCPDSPEALLLVLEPDMIFWNNIYKKSYYKKNYNYIRIDLKA